METGTRRHENGDSLLWGVQLLRPPTEASSALRTSSGSGLARRRPAPPPPRRAGRSPAPAAPARGGGPRAPRPTSSSTNASRPRHPRADRLEVPRRRRVPRGEPGADVPGVVRRQPRPRLRDDVVHDGRDAQRAPHLGVRGPGVLRDQPERGRDHGVVEPQRPVEPRQRPVDRHLLAPQRPEPLPRRQQVQVARPHGRDLQRAAGEQRHRARARRAGTCRPARGRPGAAR